MKFAFCTLAVLALCLLAHTPTTYAETDAGSAYAAEPAVTAHAGIASSPLEDPTPDFTFEEWETRIGQYASAGQMACQNGTLNMMLDGALKMYQYFGAMLVERFVATRWPWFAPAVSASLRFLLPLIASEAKWLCRCIPVISNTEVVFRDPDGNIVMKKETITTANCCVVMPMTLNYLGFPHCDMPIQTQGDCIRRAESGAATCF
ncbi:MAG: hypothetical protein HY962_10900 [Ignavibacteriae bacterium]|nr:hypothetical protein [Ignavibacteriota bacterium]